MFSSILGIIDIIGGLIILNDFSLVIRFFLYSFIDICPPKTFNTSFGGANNILLNEVLYIFLYNKCNKLYLSHLSGYDLSKLYAEEQLKLQKHPSTKNLVLTNFNGNGTGGVSNG